LRRVEFAWAGYYVAEWASFVALSVYAYGFGGAAAVGVLGLVRTLPAALCVPAGTALADRTRRERVLLLIQSVPSRSSRPPASWRRTVRTGWCSCSPV